MVTDPKIIQCGCGASHTHEHPHFGEQDSQAARAYPVEVEEALSAWIAKNDKDGVWVSPAGWWYAGWKFGCAHKTEDQERGGATSNLEALLAIHTTNQNVFPEQCPSDGQLRPCDALLATQEALSLKAQLAERDAQVAGLTKERDALIREFGEFKVEQRQLRTLHYASLDQAKLHNEVIHGEHLRLTAQLAERDAQIAAWKHDAELAMASDYNNALRVDELKALVEALRGVVEAAQNHVNAPSCRRPHMSFGHETCMPSGDPCDLHTYHMLRHAVSQLRALDQAQQPHQTAQERQQPQQTQEQHPGGVETKDSAEGPEKGLK